VALEAARRFAAVLSFGLLAGGVGGGVGLEAGLAAREAVQRAVELAVAAAVEVVAVGASRGDRDRRRPGEAGELAVTGEAVDAADLADQLGGGQHTAAAFGQQPRASWATSGASSRASGSIERVSSRMRLGASRATRALVVCSARASRLATDSGSLQPAAESASVRAEPTASAQHP
jgi:hypothetical protein